MKKYVIFFVVNALLFVALQTGFILTAFLLGLASSDKYVTQQWILYFAFCLFHLLVFFFIPYFNKTLSRKDFLFGALLIAFAWLVTAWYINN